MGPPRILGGDDGQLPRHTQMQDETDIPIQDDKYPFATTNKLANLPVHNQAIP
jgi:hypothetical protein